MPATASETGLPIDADLLTELLAMPSVCEDPRSIHARIQAAADIIAEHRPAWPDQTTVGPL